MDSSRSSLPNVDRANSTLFKRYLEEQHKSVIQASNHQKISNPISSTIQITHRQQQDSSATKFNNNNNQTAITKRRYSNGRRSSGDNSKQHSSHTNRFMKRFQRQHKTRETITNIQKRDGRPYFEFHDPSAISKPTRTDQQINCTCLNLSEKNGADHHCSPIKQVQVPRLSLTERFHSSAQHRRQPIQPEIVQTSTVVSKPVRSPLQMLLPTSDKTVLSKPTTKESHSIEQNLRVSPSIEPTTTLNTEIERKYLLDSPVVNLLDEDWPIVNELLQEISIEMSDPMNPNILLEIEESLAQRIYDCIVEQVDESENDTRSHSTLTNDSSVLSTIAPRASSNNITSHESYDVAPSPIITTREQIDKREKYVQSIRQQPPTPFNNNHHHHLDQNRHSTPFNPILQHIENDARSPFAQSLFEPVNLLRTIATNEKDEFNFFPSSFSFENHENLNLNSNSNLNLNMFQQQENQSKSELSGKSQQHSLPFFNHLLQPRSTPIDNNISAFKPIEPATTRASTSFALKRPQVINSSMTMNWFGQS